MRIVHLIWGLNVGGSETLLVDIANEQSSYAEVFVVIGNDTVDQVVTDLFSRRVTTRFLRRPPGSWNPWHLVNLVHTLRGIGPDIIHVHQNSFAAVAHFLSAPMALTVHGMNDDFQHLEKFAAVFAVSEAVRQDIVTKHPRATPIVIHNGINFAKVTRKIHYGREPFRIVQVGRLYHETKGQHILLKALHRLKRELPDKHVEVDFVGEGTSHEYLCDLAKELGITESCRFLGQQPRSRIYEYLHTYDLLVQPSRSEGFGLAVVEAMGAGVPVLVSDIEGPMELIDYGNNGYYFRTEDHLDCAEKIARIVMESHDKKSCEQHRRTAEYARERFDISATARRYFEEYQKLNIEVTPARMRHG
ncbi:glycosyl transferase family 1 [Nitrospira sp. KM1]|uniref:glycosyltransferase n=1 Tax=Nitrospira sp. KM1 TaxID=1936990 RepID=UPI0013A799BA|nr:glycosyltransferase [Nitrospira sp. KM1]BCA57122.1 glycosyl transferase family 1 [Nitrospira sp. KM1]